MKNAAKFRTLPSLDFKIPFKLEEEALVNWLTDLATEDGEEACAQILSLLQALNKTEIGFKQRFSFLQIIQGYLKQHINRLDNACWDAGFPLSDDEVFYAEIITWNYFDLSTGFFIAAQYANKKNDMILCLAHALQAIGQAQLHIAITYLIPNKGFWHSLYQIFLWAEKNNLQNVEIESPEFKNLTLNTLFTRSLMFQLCDTYQFHAREMRIVFDFLPKVCGDFPISIFFGSDQGLCFIDLNSDTPPLRVERQNEIGSLVRYFSPTLVSNTIKRIIDNGGLWHGTLKSINNTVFRRVQSALSLQQKRKYHRRKENQVLQGVIGLEDIIAFLYKSTQNKQADLRVLNPEQPNEETGQVIKPPTQKVSVQEIIVYDSSATGYSVSWNHGQVKTKVGDLFGLISEDRKRLEIAIIRRVLLSKNLADEDQHNFHFGSEVFGFESEIAYLTGLDPEEAPGGWAVFIPGIELLEIPDTVVFPTGRLHIGENAYLYRKNQRILTLLMKELHSTAAISHVELHYLKA